MTYHQLCEKIANDRGMRFYGEFLNSAYDVARSGGIDALVTFILSCGFTFSPDEYATIAHNIYDRMLDGVVSVNIEY